jgi:hypothetical protein
MNIHNGILPSLKGELERLHHPSPKGSEVVN